MRTVEMNVKILNKHQNDVHVSSPMKTLRSDWISDSYYLKMFTAMWHRKCRHVKLGHNLQTILKRLLLLLLSCIFI